MPLKHWVALIVSATCAGTGAALLAFKISATGGIAALAVAIGAMGYMILSDAESDQ